MRTTEPRGPGLPPNVEAEQIVLGALMQDQYVWDQVGDIVDAEDFGRADHRLIFKKAASLLSSGNACDLILLAASLEAEKQLAEVGGFDYLSYLVLRVKDTANVRSHALLLRELSTLRLLNRTATNIIRDTELPGERTSRDLLDEAEISLQTIFEYSTRGLTPIKLAKQILPAVVNRIDELYHSSERFNGMPTGFPQLDHILSGLQQSTLLVLVDCNNHL